MAAPPSTPTPEAFITSIIDRISSLSSPSPSLPPHPHPQPQDEKTSPNFSSLLSTLTRDKQESITRLLTTLHFFFPHELIPALDLLDRGLVTRMVVKKMMVTSPSPTTTSPPPPPSQSDLDPNLNTEQNPAYEVFYVQSASFSTTIRHRPPHHHPPTHEVRLATWNCTCPAFAISAFGMQSALTPLHRNDGTADDANDNDNGNNKNKQQHNLPTTTIKSAHFSYTATVNPKHPDLGWKFGGTLTLSSSSPLTALNPEPEPSPPPHGNHQSPVPIPVCKHILAALLGRQIPALFGEGVRRREVGRGEAAAWAAGGGRRG